MTIVYHRTSYDDLINSVYTSGFKAGKGNFYGDGFYGTYDLISQEKSNMAEKYGHIIVKFAVPIEDFFIFEWEEFIKAPIYKELEANEDNFIEKQIEYYHIDLYDNISNIPNDANYSSRIALWLYHNSNLERKVLGIIFEGSSDGKIIVAYDTESIIPLSYKVDGDSDFSKVNRNKDYMKRVLRRKLSPFYTKGKDIPKWLQNATKKDEDFYIKPGGFVVWRNGKWISGVWENGEWQAGIWFDGTWFDGTWGYGIWKDGEWLNGVWKSGTWKNGTWYKGRWKYGTWAGGTWKSGVWEQGDWENGIWEEGWIYDPNREGNFDLSWEIDGDFVKSPINPKEYWE